MKKIVFVLVSAAVGIMTILPACGAEEKPRDQEITVENIRSDFEALYQGLQSAHVNLYVHKNKADYDALYKQTYNGFDRPLSLFQTQVAFQKFTAYGDVAHARIEFPNKAYNAFRQNGGRSFPIFLRIAEGRAYVGEDYSGHEQISLGDEILSLNGVAMADWLSRTSAHISADKPYIAHSLLEFMFPKYLWLEIGDVQTYSLKLRSPDNKKYEVALQSSTKEAQHKKAHKLPSQFSLNSNERTSKMLEGKIAYLRPGPFYNVETPDNIWDNAAFKTFIDTAFETYLAAEAETLIIDLRQNPGGDNSFSDLMIAWFADEKFRFFSEFFIRSSDEAAASNQARLDGNPGAVKGLSGLLAKKYAQIPRGDLFDFDIPYVLPNVQSRFEGGVYVIVNRHSYSNAVNVAAIVQDYGFGKIVGEKTSDMATTYGGMETFTLPSTGIMVGFPKAHIIRPSGEKQSDGVTPDWLLPSLIVPGPDDAVLQALLDRLNSE